MVESREAKKSPQEDAQTREKPKVTPASPKIETKDKAPSKSEESKEGE
jgi:hypothetical protein